jgi:hypothetical protein
LARDSLNKDLDLLPDSHHVGLAASSMRGVVLSQWIDAKRRTVCFLFFGASPYPDGARIALAAEQRRQMSTILPWRCLQP